MSHKLFWISLFFYLCFSPLAATPPTPRATQAQSKSHICTYCQQSFTRRGNLKRHVEGIHHKRTHPCTQCTKVFKYPSSLKHHVRTAHEHHSRDCEQCGQKFINLRDLKIHVSVKHQGTVYPCQDCDKIFANPYNLRAHHNSIHAGNTHTCPLCNKSYIHRSSLSQHCTRVHKVQLRSLLQQASGEYFTTTSGDPEINSCTDNAPIHAGEVPLDPLTENGPLETSPGLAQDNIGYLQQASLLGQDMEGWMESYLEHPPQLTFAPDEGDLEPAPKCPRLEP